MTLLELLAVMVIILILAAFVIPGVRGVIGSSNLKGSADLTLGRMDLARQVTTARNLLVDLRVYQDTTKPLDANGNHPYRMLALVIPASAGGTSSDQFLMQPLILPGDVIIDSNVQFSSLLNTKLGATGLQPVAATELASAPASVRGLPYIQFAFLPNGTANLDPSQQWCLTLVNGNLARSGTATLPAANFVTIILDPHTGHAREYQP
jgi:uncharacterized protein (TIGR02596 family)